MSETPAIPDPLDWFAPLVPDIRDRLAPYQVDTSAVDAEVLAIFVEQLREIMAGLSVAVAGDEMGVRHAAHSLMGIGGTAGFPSLSVAGEELSRAAKAGDFQRCAALAARISEWMRVFEH